MLKASPVEFILSWQMRRVKPANFTRQSCNNLGESQGIKYNKSYESAYDYESL